MGKYSEKLLGQKTGGSYQPGKYSSKLLGSRESKPKVYNENPYKKDTGEISTITAKPIQEPSYNDWYKSADFKTLLKAGFVDNNESKIKLFSEARGISPDRYEVKDGKIWFQGDDGQMYPETPKEVVNLLKKFMAELPSELPADVGATAGAVFGNVPGAVVGGAGGELLRKQIGKIFFGDDQNVSDYALDMAVQAAFGSLDAGVAKKLATSLSSRKIKKATGGKISDDFTQIIGDLEPGQRIDGMIARGKGKKIGVDLKPHQAMDDPTLTGYHSMLRDNPKTARAVRKNDIKLDEQVNKAGNDLIRDISDKKVDPFEVAEDLSKTATQAIENMKLTRSNAVKGLYDEANKVVDVDVKPALDEIARLKGKVKPGMKVHSALNRLERMLNRTVEVKKPKKFKNDLDPNGPTLDDVNEYVNQANDSSVSAVKTLSKKYKKEDAEIYRQMKREAKEIVDSSGDFEDWKEVISEGGLNLKTAHMMSDKNTISELLRRRPGLFKKDAALHAEHFANKKGFDTPDELFQSWLSREKRGDAIERVTNDLYQDYQVGNDMGRAIEHADRLYKEEIKTLGKKLSKTKKNIKNASAKKIPESRLEVLDNVKQEIDAILQGKDASTITNKMKRKMQGVKDILTTQTDKQSREYQVARALFSAASPKIKNVEKSIVGVLSRMTTDEMKEKSIQKIFSSPQSIRTAKKYLEKENPELWKDTVAEYFRAGFEKASKKTQGSGGNVINRPGKYVTGMWDLQNQKKLKLAMEGMKDVDGNPLYNRVTDFFEVMQKASIGHGKESATQPRLKMEKDLQGLAGKLNASMMNLRQAGVNFFLKDRQEKAFDKNAKKLLDLMQTQEGVDLIAKAKGYGPNTEKGIIAATTLLLMATESNAGKGKEIISTYLDQRNQDE